MKPPFHATKPRRQRAMTIAEAQSILDASIAKACHAKPSNTSMDTTPNETAAKLMVLHDCVWQLGNTLRDCMSRLETIKETHPEMCLEQEIDQAKHTLERYAKGPMLYKPHPFGWKFDRKSENRKIESWPSGDHTHDGQPKPTNGTTSTGRAIGRRANSTPPDGCPQPATDSSSQETCQ